MLPTHVLPKLLHMRRYCPGSKLSNWDQCIPLTTSFQSSGLAPSPRGVRSLCWWRDQSVKEYFRPSSVCWMEEFSATCAWLTKEVVFVRMQIVRYDAVTSLQPPVTFERFKYLYWRIRGSGLHLLALEGFFLGEDWIVAGGQQYWDFILPTPKLREKHFLLLVIPKFLIILKYCLPFRCPWVQKALNAQLSLCSVDQRQVPIQCKTFQQCVE